MGTAVNTRAAPAVALGRWSDPLAVGLAALGFAFAGLLLWTLMTIPGGEHTKGLDMGIYRDAVERLLAGGPWFLPEQTTGRPYTLEVGHVMYPPIAVPLMAVAVLPWPFWYAVPLGILAAVVVWHRPSPWGWAGIAALMAYPATPQLIVSGNPAMWIAAFAALGTVWRPAFALVLLKPSLFVFALPGVTSRGWWAIVGVMAALSAVTIFGTVEWLGVVVNARGPYAGLTTLWRDLAFMLVPFMAWRFSRGGKRAGYG